MKGFLTDVCKARGLRACPSPTHLLRLHLRAWRPLGYWMMMLTLTQF